MPAPQLNNETDGILNSIARYQEYKTAENNSKRGYLIVKRVTDIIGAGLGLAVLLPFLMIIALLIKLDCPKAPVFFSQTRIGKGVKPFTMYKFRSMIPDAEQMLGQLLDQNEVSGAMFKMKDDPRVTRIGRFIRRTSIDELPQLWNVVRGDMSLVGPRPPLPREVEEYTDYDKQRLSVTPGCTGLWQVTGRNSVGFREMVELDLAYIRKRSMGLDLRIVMRTAKILFKTNSAY